MRTLKTELGREKLRHGEEKKMAKYSFGEKILDSMATDGKIENRNISKKQANVLYSAIEVTAEYPMRSWVGWQSKKTNAK